MRYKTDLDAVKHAAVSPLHTHINETKFSPIVVRHPFTSSGFVGISNNGEMELLNILESMESKKKWQEFMEKQITNADSVYRILNFHNSPILPRSAQLLIFNHRTVPRLIDSNDRNILNSERKFFIIQAEVMDMQKHRFSVLVNCAITDENNPKKLYEDSGFLILPDCYSQNGKPLRLVINCHGAGGTVTTDDSQVEHQILTQYLVANGFAVMDVNGLPLEYAKENDIDIRNNIGSPIAIRSYIEAYRYCMKNFNLKPEVFVHGSSMGGISSTNLVLSGEIPVIAHSAFCPVLDTYNEIFLHPWSNGLPKYALGKIYGFDKDENGEYKYNEEKINGYNPVENPKIERYPVPVKFWHCEDDKVVSVEITRKFVNKIIASGGEAHLRTFANGGHEPQLVGEHVKSPCGNTLFGQIKLEIFPAVEESFAWIKSFDL